MQTEFASEEEEIKWHEERIRTFAVKEYDRILKAIASGHTPDIIDRILLRMAKNPG